MINTSFITRISRIRSAMPKRLAGYAVLPQNFSTHLKISKTDAISGATWSFNIFKAALEEALKKYRRKAK